MAKVSKPTTNRYTVLAPAKLNLFLHVHQLRPDGYHNLNTFFQLVDLCDTLTFQTRTDNHIVIDNPVLRDSREHNDRHNDKPNEDLCYQAAQRLKAVTGYPYGIDIRIDKRIPIGGGLGGGSSDAATVLYVLNQLWQTHLPREELLAIGLALGADVPIFLVGENAYASGRGEKITTAASPFSHAPATLVILYPKVFVSTATLFHTPRLKKRADSHAMPVLSDVFFENDFTTVAFENYPEIKTAATALSQFSPAHLTGTGSCLYAVLDDPKKADTIRRALAHKYDVFIVNTINRSPLLEFSL
ncbi:4-(cytidine 5'-diphospho)-2-C-methyl-D-erythritol kinase [Cardiobacteriales bacterium ML27]|uniref:4-diphosphocytidyl-2-C-methyl-D-erythritol kinase n=1 Tax=Ostreibacterium oceani TaxID=2654998 RepID=A0A6N7F116_9GAMM|nr:4-(cytidine 5'-diphospho)-2-C-methyl-D-erythritol kinase [Ostreibacterium oceani]